MQNNVIAPAWFRYVSYGFAAMLLLFAGLQFNDPDPIRWMALYAGSAAISIALTLRLRWYPAAIIVGGIAAIWSGYLLARVVGLVDFSDLFTKMSEKGGAVEEAREAGGTAIVSLWLATAATIAKRRIAKSKPVA
jgi:hypothetical protein